MKGSANDLIYFQEVAEAGNITRAAERLGISQPSLSLAIQKLEAAIGASLLIRGKAGVRLTKAGETFLVHSRHILQEWENLKAAVLEDEQEIQGHFSIGAHPSVALFTFSGFMRELLLKHTRLEFKLYHNLSRRITEDVINFKIDFGIVVNPVKQPDLTIIRLCEDVVRLWKSKEHDSFLQDPHHPDSVLVCDPDLVQSEGVIKKLKRLNFMKSKRILPSSNLEVVTDLVASGAGYGIIPSRVVRKNHPNDLVPIEEGVSFVDEICLVYRKDLNSSNAAQYIKDMIQDSLV